ncbi:MAG: GIY-YIG nuclease family protein [Cyclobacteriaceae bacterium]|nr:GIY-YIG nuclease family protein [Cyclobacteriaceae bacterium]MCH8516246.1 GIY-YIG nuclease family protein [Cyclobacteriaceae bacterium]
MKIKNRFAIVDIETTGGFAKGHRMVEIAVVIVENGDITETFESLINPGRKIPANVSGIHGIYDEDVADAPSWVEIAPKVYQLLENAVFVAHSVNFDYTFVKAEMEDCGIQLNLPKLCTVRLSRKLLPGHRSYSLGSLCSDLKINISARHRAMGDAYATAVLFQLLLEKDTQAIIQKSIKRNSKEAILPDYLDKEEFEKLPESCGLYYLLNEKAQPIYIGKAKNIKKRVYSHFGGSSETYTKQAYQKEVRNVSYELCGNDFIAFIRESQEIHKHWPKYNRSQKKPSQLWAVISYENQMGYKILELVKRKKGLPIIFTFNSAAEGRQFLHQICSSYELCPKLCGIQKVSQECYDYSVNACKGACIGKEEVKAYNQRLSEGIEKARSQRASYVAIGKGRTSIEKSVVYVENGVYQGHTFSESIIESEIPQMLDNIPPAKTTPFIQHYIFSEHYMKDQKVIVLQA